MDILVMSSKSINFTSGSLDKIEPTSVLQRMYHSDRWALAEDLLGCHYNRCTFGIHSDRANGDTLGTCDKAFHSRFGIWYGLHNLVSAHVAILATG